MITTGIEKRVQVQQIIDSQLPEFVVSENPNALEFFKQYYISQEYRGGPVDLSDNLDQYLKLDNLTPEVIRGSTSLSAGITTASGTISVDSTKGFPNEYGLIKIDDEIITYTGVTTILSLVVYVDLVVLQHIMHQMILVNLYFPLLLQEFIPLVQMFRTSVHYS